MTSTSQKLFQVLVVGGALVGAGCREEDPARPDGAVGGGDAGPGEADAASGVEDAGLPTDATMTLDVPETPGEDGGALMECGFCPNVECCVTDAAGNPVTRAGFACCWGTSC